jgi:hypothetical protein
VADLDSESANTRLIDAQCSDERLAVKRRYVCPAGHEGYTRTKIGPSSVRNKLWQTGSYHTFRMTPPACRRVSAKQGNPPTLGRIAAARFIAWFKFSIALLRIILEFHLSLNHAKPNLPQPHAVPSTRRGLELRSGLRCAVLLDLIILGVEVRLQPGASGHPVIVN